MAGAYHTRGSVVREILQAGCRTVERGGDFGDFEKHEIVSIVFLEVSGDHGNRYALEFEPEQARALASMLLSAVTLVELERKKVPD